MTTFSKSFPGRLEVKQCERKPCRINMINSIDKISPSMKEKCKYEQLSSAYVVFRDFY